MGHVTILKILVMGESGVGKTSITQAFTRGDYNSTFLPTVGVDYKCKVIEVNGVQVKLGIWDTAGMERFRAVTTNTYRNVHGVVFVYDVSDLMTMIKLNDWIEELRFHSTKENVACLIVGNKLDKARAIPRNQGQEFARKHRMMFIESSVKTRVGIDVAFEELAHKIIETPGLWEKDALSNICISSEERRRSQIYSCLNIKYCFK